MQGELNFDSPASGDGYVKWLAGRRLAAQEVAHRMNLPIGHLVEVWLHGGIRLKGELRLEEDVLFIEEERVRHLPLRIDRATFIYREIESCVRLD